MRSNIMSNAGSLFYLPKTFLTNNLSPKILNQCSEFGNNLRMRCPGLISDGDSGRQQRAWTDALRAWTHRFGPTAGTSEFRVHRRSAAERATLRLRTKPQGNGRK